MSTQNAIETEVKIAVPHWDTSEVATRLSAMGLELTEPRVFEANFVYDMAQQPLRSAKMLLRLRRVGDRNTLTWKGPPQSGPHKTRPELEVKFDPFDTMHQILGHLGYQTYFKYEKYRTEFGTSDGGTVTFDETPIGNFLELEGPGLWIDEMALRMGFSESDYILESYGTLYLSHCAKAGVQPLNMVFPSRI
jgi:adenylate cyclase, class 2